MPRYFKKPLNITLHWNCCNSAPCFFPTPSTLGHFSYCTQSLFLSCFLHTHPLFLLHPPCTVSVKFLIASQLATYFTASHLCFFPTGSTLHHCLYCFILLFLFCLLHTMPLCLLYPVSASFLLTPNIYSFVSVSYTPCHCFYYIWCFHCIKFSISFILSPQHTTYSTISTVSSLSYYTLVTICTVSTVSTTSVVSILGIISSFLVSGIHIIVF